uniref:Nanos-type domain-containing protein n=1 Tax=Strongyloides papillosus TaxID=174720 RepID=A0A0N5CF54_STREA
MYSYEYDLKPLDFCETSSFLKESLKRYEANECERLIHESFCASFKDDDVLPASIENIFEVSMFETSQDSSKSDLSTSISPVSKLLSSSYKQFVGKSSNTQNSNGILATERCSDKRLSNNLNNLNGITPTFFNGNPMTNNDFAACWYALFNSGMSDHRNGIPFLKATPSVGREPFTSMLAKPMKQPSSYDNGQSTNSKNQSAAKSPKQSFHCSFCFNNERVRCERQKIEFNANNPKGLWNKHNNKDDKGIVTCPFLRKLICPSCGATGDFAHTRRHCPLNNSIYK